MTPVHSRPRTLAAISLSCVVLSVLLVALSACSLPGTAASDSPTGTTVPTAGTPTTGASIEQQRETAIAVISPSVVRIDNPGKGLGTGVVYSKNGYIVTNDHVIAGGRQFVVTFANGHTATATLVGGYRLDDLAVIKAGTTDLPAATFADSSALNVGQSVLAVGNPLGINFTVTEGIVSALDRTVSEGSKTPPILHMVQTSAAINPGNSGGALVDMTGKVIGIPTLAAIDPSSNVAANGVGFAVPSNTVERIAPQLIKYGKVVNTGRATVGVAVETVTPELAARYKLPVDYGVLVAQVDPNSPAAQAGIPTGSVIVQIDNKAINHDADLTDALATQAPGEKGTVTVVDSQGKQVRYHVTLGELSASTG